MRSPEVISGYRGPRNEQHADRVARRRTGPEVLPVGKTVIQFGNGEKIYLKYRLQLTAPEEIKRSDGTLRRDKALVVIATEGYAVLDNKKDAEAIARIKGGKWTETTAEGREVEHEVEAHQNYGIDFRDFSEVLAKRQSDEENKVVEILRDPKAKERIMRALAASGDVTFPLPKGPAPNSQAGTVGEGA